VRMRKFPNAALRQPLLGCVQVDIGRDDQPYIHGNGTPGANSDDFAFLQYTEQLLAWASQVAVVEKQRSLIGGLKPALTTGGGARKRAGLMTEELAFREIFANGSTESGQETGRRDAPVMPVIL